MIAKHALTVIGVVSALVLEEVHQLFSNFPTTRLNLFPFDDTKISVQWYVYDWGQVLSPLILAYVLHQWMPTRKMRYAALSVLVYRISEVVTFGLWNKQHGYSVLLTLLGLALFLIVLRWKKD